MVANCLKHSLGGLSQLLHQLATAKVSVLWSRSWSRSTQRANSCWWRLMQTRERLTSSWSFTNRRFIILPWRSRSMLSFTDRGRSKGWENSLLRSKNSLSRRLKIQVGFRQRTKMQSKQCRKRVRDVKRRKQQTVNRIRKPSLEITMTNRT